MIRSHIRQSVRALGSRRGFAATAVIILSIGIGAATTVFGIIDAVMLRPLPFPHPRDLVVVWETSAEDALPQMFASPPDYADWIDRSRALESIGAFAAQAFTIASGGEPEYVSGARVSATLLTALRVTPSIGRPFRDDDDRPGAAPVVIVSHEWWQRRLDGDPHAVGRSIRVDGMPATIVGVLPDAAMVPPPIALFGRAPAERADVIAPFAMSYGGAQRGAHFMTVVARLAPAVSLDAADRELKGIAAQIAREHPASNRTWSTALVPLDTQVAGAVRPALLVLAGSVGLLLLLACANIASLLVAVAIARSREFAIRAAIGATVGQLSAQLLAEGAVLAAAGACGGLGIAALATRLIRDQGAGRVPRLAEAVVDWRVASAAVGAACLAALLFSLAPLFHMRRSAPGHARLAVGAATTARGVRVQDLLVAAEVGLSVVLLVAGALLAQSFLRLRGIDPGFRPQNVLTFSVTLPPARYPDRSDRARLVGAAVERLETAPGIVSAGAIDAVPFVNDRQGTGFALDGESLANADASRHTNVSFVGPGYFRALGVPVVAGRVFDERDAADAPPVAVINEVLAGAYGGRDAAIGRRITLGVNAQTPRTIVAVVGNEKNLGLDRAAGPNAYVPYLQAGGSARVTFVVRSAMDAAGAASAARGAMHAVDAGLPMFDVRTMAESMARAMARPRFVALLLTMFGGTALALAAVGVFGVMSQAVARRAREIGVRVAIGADSRLILTLILGRAARLTLAGLVPGIAAAVAAGRLLSGLLFGIAGTDTRTFVLVAAAMMAVALASALVPAIRAIRIDPIQALRAE